MSTPSNDWQGGGLSSPGVEGPLAEPEDRPYEGEEPEQTDDPTRHYDDLGLDEDDLPPDEDQTTDFTDDDDLMHEMEDLRRSDAANDTRPSATSGYPRPRSAREEDDEQSVEAPNGPFDAVILALSRYWYVAVALFVIVLAFLGYRLLFSGGTAEETQTAAPEAPAPAQPAAQGTPAQGNTADLPVTDTGIVLTEKKDGGAYYVSAGEIDGRPFAWGGKTEETKEGPRTTLEGPTAFEEVRSVELRGGGSVTPGSFGRAEPGQPVLYVSFMRTTVGGQSHTNGEYHAVEEAEDEEAGSEEAGGQDRLVLTGTFSDQVVEDNPADEPDEIVRLYEEHPAGSSAEKAYKVAFKAKSDAPIPALIGWRPPASSGGAE